MCPKCEATILPHRACKKCGWYKDRTVKTGLAQAKRAIAKDAKRAKPAKQTEPEKTNKPGRKGHEGHDHE